MIKAVFFDLFFTLINPIYADKNEYDVLGLSREAWEQYAQEEDLYQERALGKIKSGKEIIRRIVSRIPLKISEEQIDEILRRREERMKRALLHVDSDVLQILRRLSDQSIDLCLVSNADMIDCKYWSISPMAEYFRLAVFSCHIGIVKPDTRIYLHAMNELGAAPQESLFVGDGGSNELHGARLAGMKTVFSECLTKKPAKTRTGIELYADHSINRMEALLTIVK